MMAEMGTDHGGEVVKLTKKEREIIEKYVHSRAEEVDLAPLRWTSGAMLYVTSLT